MAAVLPAVLIALAEGAREALLQQGIAALREVEDDDFDVDLDDLSADGIAVDVTDPAEEDRRRHCAVAAYDLFIARLKGKSVRRRVLENLRQTHGEDELLIALSGVADALQKVGRALTDAEVLTVHRARADARQLLQTPIDMPGFGDGIETDPDGYDGGGDVARALRSVIDGAVIEDSDDDSGEGLHGGLEESGPVAVADHGALLRVQALTADAAMALQGIAQATLLAQNVVILPSAPDELLLTASGDVADATAALVRAATSLAQSLPEGAPLRLALVATSGDLIDDAVRSSALLPTVLGSGARLAFDERAWALAGELAELPDSERQVDPRAPFGQERWELSSLLPRPNFRGRDDDVQVCANCLGGGGTNPRLLILGGPPGIGKSSLLRASLREAGLADERAAVAWGAADPLQPTPYAAVVGMLRALARAPAGHPRAPARLTRLLNGLAEALPEGEGYELRSHADVVLDLLGASGVDVDDLAERRSPRALRTALRRAVLLVGKALLARAGDDRPLVFVVGGAEAMDAPTRDALSFVARRLGARVRVVLLSTSPRTRLPASFEEDFEVTRHEVLPLEREATRAMAHALLDVSLAGDAVESTDAGVANAIDMLLDRSKGSPLFVAHAVRWAVEGGYLTKNTGLLTGVAGGGWDASRFEVVQSRIPARLDKLLHARVLRLPTAARQVLGHCAALGLTFLPAAVERVGVHLGLSREDVAQAVQLLVETGFLARSQRRPGAPIFADSDAKDDELLVFEHPLLRLAAEQALSEDEAKAVHGVVADALEALLDTSAIAPRLARHHKLAERRRRALEYLVVAVRRARRLDDRQGAMTMANEGLELVAADETDIIFTLHLELAAVLEFTAGQGPKHQKALKDALKHLVRAADRTGDLQRQAVALARVARFNLFLGDLEKAEEAALRGLTKAREGDAIAQHVGDVTGSTSLASLGGVAGSSASGLVQSGESGVDPDATTSPPRAAHSTSAVQAGHHVRDILRLVGLIRFAARDVDGARRALDEARRLTDPSDRRVLGGIEHQTGLFRLERNDPLGALEHLFLARQHKRATADLAGEAACLDAIADVYVRTGRLWTALNLLVRALAIREAIGDDAGFAQSLKNRADVLLMAGDIDAAREEASRARTLAKALGLDRVEHQAAVVVARAELTREDAAAAESILDSMRRRVDERRDPFSAMESELLSARAKLLRARQQTGAARDRLLKTALSRARAAVELGERRGFLSGQVLGNALLGDVLLESGDVGMALPCAQRAAELLDDRSATGLSVEEALMPYVRALRAIGDDDDANVVADRARTLLDERARRLPEALQARFWAVPGRAQLKTDGQGPKA